MRRAQIQFQEEVYEILRHRAFLEKKSIAKVIREIVEKDIFQTNHHPSFSIKDFSFIGAGRTKQGLLEPVSERHDEALREAFQK